MTPRQPPTLRFTMRWMMATVAILAIVFAEFPGWAESRRSRFQITFDEHTLDYQHLQNRLGQDPTSPQDTPRLAYHRSMKAKYRWAARYPWLPVWPDPTMPE
jgi:hypothetical protein